MNWYLIHTKPRLEKTALENLERQNYRCYLPMLAVEKLRKGELVHADEPLFPRYLFIQLDTGMSALSWSPIRSTKGVSRLVSFGNEPAKVPDALIESLQTYEQILQNQPVAMFEKGTRVQITNGPFAGVEGIYQMAEGERRVMVLIELMSKPVTLPVEPGFLRKVN